MPQTQTARKDISNPAKLLRALIHATGITDCKQLSEMLAIPVRTLQRLKLEVAETVDNATANDAKHAISGAATSAISGASTANDAISGASGASPSRAYIESPSEILSTEEQIDSPSSVPPKPKRSQARGARLPGEWTLPGPWAEWVRVNFPTVSELEITREADSFRDYWIAKPGAQACKLDWEATWRNWCRKSLSSAGRHRGGPPQPQHTAHWKDQARAERAKWVNLMTEGGVQ
jgi:hypothetical protein